MNKKTMLRILLNLIFVIVFNVVFFLVGGTEHSVSVWISYGFIHFSYLMLIASPVFAGRGKNATVFGLALDTISSAYFLIEFFVGLIFILVESEFYKFSLIVHVIITGIYAVGLLSNLIANESTKESTGRHEMEVSYIKNVSSRVKRLIGKATDKKANREIERVYDMLHSSPSRSNLTVKNIEEEIENEIRSLTFAVSKDDTATIISVAERIIVMAEERNRKVKNEM